MPPRSGPGQYQFWQLSKLRLPAAVAFKRPFATSSGRTIPAAREKEKFLGSILVFKNLE